MDVTIADPTVYIVKWYQIEAFRIRQSHLPSQIQNNPRFVPNYICQIKSNQIPVLDLLLYESRIVCPSVNIAWVHSRFMEIFAVVAPIRDGEWKPEVAYCHWLSFLSRNVVGLTVLNPIHDRDHTMSMLCLCIDQMKSMLTRTLIGWLLVVTTKIILFWVSFNSNGKTIQFYLKMYFKFIYCPQVSYCQGVYNYLIWHIQCTKYVFNHEF